MDAIKKRLLITVLLAVLIFACSFYGYWQKKSVPEKASSQMPSITQFTVNETDDVVIYVSGAVNQPGVFKIKNGSRIIDAINQAGGLALGADCSNLNLAQEVKDGMRIQVDTNIDNKQVNGINNNKEPGKININTAGKNELDKLPGIGPALSDRIIEYRKNNGPFKEVADLKKVGGIGEAKFKQIKDRIGI